MYTFEKHGEVWYLVAADGEQAKLLLLQAEGQQALTEMQTTLSAILAEAGSADPWTSRERPTFLHVICGVILLCMIGSIVGIWWPSQVFQASENLSSLLGAIPESLWWFFGAGYLVCTGARSFDKWRAPGQSRSSPSRSILPRPLRSAHGGVGGLFVRVSGANLRPVAGTCASPAWVRSRVGSGHSPWPCVTYTVPGIRSQAHRRARRAAVDQPGPRTARVGRPARRGRTPLECPSTTAIRVHRRAAGAVVAVSRRLVPQGTRHSNAPAVIVPLASRAKPRNKTARRLPKRRFAPRRTPSARAVGLPRTFLRCYVPLPHSRRAVGFSIPPGNDVL